jgi:hypothetical protein
MKIFSLTFLILSLHFSVQQTETVNAIIYADNWFEFYVNGVKVKEDPLDYTPYNAVKFTFEVPQTGIRLYAVKASDFTTESGYEYTGTSKPQLGEGSLRMVFSDGTISDNKWRCMTTSYGPTNSSITAGCNSNNLSACKLQLTEEPVNWYSKSFDDSKWQAATLFPEQEFPFETPNYSKGQCGIIIDPLTRVDITPSTKTTTEEECQNPKKQSWGSSQFIWQPDLKRDNTILCRYSFTPSQKVIRPGDTSASIPPRPISNGGYIQLGLFLMMSLILTLLI